MDKRIGLFVGLTALFAMGSAHAQNACPESPRNAGINVATGHNFETYYAPEISWEQAKICAASKTVGGAQGYLATITSSAEDAYVNGLKLDTAGDGALRLPGEVWVGGSQLPGQSRPGTGWRWENGEGSIATLDEPSPGYSNWLPSEPNDAGGFDSESHLAIGLFADGDDPRWNDEGNLANITGYIVEYDIPRTSSDCTTETGEPKPCATIDGQTLTFPAGSFNQTADTVEFQTFEFADPRVDLDGKCTVGLRRSLTLFKQSDGFEPGVELRIPPYLCGSPKFVVVKVNSKDLSILNGAVLVVNNTAVVLPDNLFKCSDPILNNLAANPDPQYQDVVVWQSTNPDNMLENATTLPGYTGNPDYVGAATEATNGCSSTVAKVRGASYFVVGLHIDFGGGFDYPGNALGNYEEFVKLTRYKLTLLRQSIRNARSEGSLRPVVSTTMEALIALAIYRLDQGNPAGALNQVRQFLRLVNLANYTQIPDRNYNGDHLMRGENIAFTLKVKVVPFKPPAP